MDQARARRMAQELHGQIVGSWQVFDLLGNGKSALVLLAEREGEQAALKLFDPDLVEQYGREEQLERIRREIVLGRHGHQNLIEVYEGGLCEATGYLYVVMALKRDPVLEHFVGEFPREKIRSVVAQLADAAEYLEQRGLAHRDIKPSNICIRQDFSSACLLDLGVLRPVMNSSLTDASGKVFLGTLRYSPPEFLYRREEDSVEGWRAVTFYQLGGVLHDLIMRRPLFEEFSQPFARLVDAIREDIPRIWAKDVPSDLLALANDCLEKNPRVRLELVSWERFRRERVEISRDHLRERILSRQRSAEASAQKTGALQDELDNFVQAFLTKFADDLRSFCVSSELFPPVAVATSASGRTGSVVLSFRPDRKRNLPFGLTIGFDLAVIDLGRRIVDIRCYACSVDDLSGALPPHLAPMFIGYGDVDQVILRATEIVLLALDRALQNRSGGADRSSWLLLE